MLMRQERIYLHKLIPVIPLSFLIINILSEVDFKASKIIIFYLCSNWSMREYKHPAVQCEWLSVSVMAKYMPCNCITRKPMYYL